MLFNSASSSVSSASSAITLTWRLTSNQIFCPLVLRWKYQFPSILVRCAVTMKNSHSSSTAASQSKWTYWGKASRWRWERRVCDWYQSYHVKDLLKEHCGAVTIGCGQISLSPWRVLHNFNGRGTLFKDKHHLIQDQKGKETFLQDQRLYFSFVTSLEIKKHLNARRQ